MAIGEKWRRELLPETEEDEEDDERVRTEILQVRRWMTSMEEQRVRALSPNVAPKQYLCRRLNTVLDSHKRLALFGRQQSSLRLIVVTQDHSDPAGVCELQ